MFDKIQDSYARSLDDYSATVSWEEREPLYRGDPNDDPLSRFKSTVCVDDVPTDVAELANREIEDSIHGFFGPESAIWHITKERRLLLASLSAILLQIAHPKVGAALDDHSTLQIDYGHRMRETYDIVDTIVFGDAVSAIRAIVIVRRMHDRVQGETEENLATVDAGERYYANDPELMRWVWATLVDQILAGYNTYVGPLSVAEIRQFYREMKLFGQLVGMPEGMAPETLVSFDEYYRRMTAEELAVGNAGLRVADGIIEQLSSPSIGRFFAAATLPPPVRAEYDLPWGSVRHRLHGVFASLVRNAPIETLPDRLRYRYKYREFGRARGND